MDAVGWLILSVFLISSSGTVVFIVYLLLRNAGRNRRVGEQVGVVDEMNAKVDFVDMNIDLYRATRRSKPLPSGEHYTIKWSPKNVFGFSTNVFESEAPRWAIMEPIEQHHSAGDRLVQVVIPWRKNRIYSFLNPYINRIDELELKVLKVEHDLARAEKQLLESQDVSAALNLIGSIRSGLERPISASPYREEQRVSFVEEKQGKEGEK